MSIPRDRWPTIVGLIGAAAVLIGFELGRFNDIEWSTGSFLGLELGAWSFATSFLAVFLILQIVLNARGTLERERRLVETAAALRETGAELERLARLDPLTGVLNRRALFERLRAEFRRSQRYSRALTVMMIDIDHFKALNDRFGHAVGDEMLAACARSMSSILRDSDVIGRYGGEEFAVFLPETSLSDGAFVAEKLRIAVQQLAVDSPDGAGDPIRVTVSVGVAAYPDADTPDEQALLNRADQALYAAKRAGRNQITVAGAGPAARVEQPAS